MKVIVVGYGIQGHKRFKVAGEDAVGIVDPVAPEANWRRLEDVPIDRFDAAIVCTPDSPKIELLRHLLERGKHVLVEKPLFAANGDDFRALEALARRTGALCVTAYNHRFEPHFVRMRDLLQSGRLGSVYRCRMFYGNGTARLVRNSAWRDTGDGVLGDLGSHLLDTVRFWFGDVADGFRIVSAERFENRAPDHVVIAAEGRPQIELEMTLLSWRNYFTCDVFAEHGSAHIESLCKWGPSSFIHRTRVLPSGRPPEESQILVQDDPTWALEYAHFKQLCEARTETDLSNDIWLHRALTRLGREIQAGNAA
ncbi:Gfo/Idh/MocA family protein [Bradyrhizobium sp. CCBAU 53338]|uniref:Gfo/Idh/MocA family protein n=1 Tax=Bradyrhizobium sp. CCBAU 53338 TaxID=1325111 RepID=UPI00188AB498|nr:Gfo/Idh/MocA family oxidoreductase [Bradyrhizobium sp. CCBAU 53338]QOZ50628.1 gfo/Idh/MocA family oxidoreductase [Bradyrhizobium sp. CCBAU 53338]